MLSLTRNRDPQSRNPRISSHVVIINAIILACNIFELRIAVSVAAGALATDLTSMSHEDPLHPDFRISCSFTEMESAVRVLVTGCGNLQIYKEGIAVDIAGARESTRHRSYRLS